MSLLLLILGCTVTKDTGTSPLPTDSSPAEDTGSEDTTPEDTTPEDTTPEDTAPEDTMPEDTGSEDTAPEDTTPEDTGSEDGTLTIKAVGQDNGSDFRTLTDAHLFDIDGDGYYGSAGYILYAVGDADEASGTMLATSPLTYVGTNHETITDLPDYLTLSDWGQDFIAAGLYPLIDDPREAPSSDVADIRSGLALNNYVSIGTSAPVVNLHFGPDAPAVFRVGVLLVTNSVDGMARVSLLDNSGRSAADSLVTNNTGETICVFFDIKNAQDGDVVGLKLVRDDGFNPNVAYVGLVFDVSEEAADK